MRILRKRFLTFYDETVFQRFKRQENRHRRRYKNSRVANSNIELLSRYGLEVILVAPPHFLPTTSLRVSHNIKEVIDEVDIIMSLRTQTERHKNQIYASLKDYANDFCITSELIGKRDIILLHPGPVHRNVDIDDTMLRDPRCKVLEQVKMALPFAWPFWRN